VATSKNVLDRDSIAHKQLGNDAEHWAFLFVGDGGLENLRKFTNSWYLAVEPPSKNTG
jgi:hypothetical protein